MAILSFALAGAANVGSFAAIIAVSAFAGGVSGGWIAQAILRFHQLDTGTTVALLRHSKWRSIGLSGGVILVGSALAASLPASIRAGTGGTFLLVGATSLTFAQLSVEQGRAMVAHNGARVIVNELGRAFSVAAPPLLATAMPGLGAVPFIWRCLGFVLIIHLSCILAAGAIKRRSSISVSDQIPPWPSGQDVFRYGAPLGVWVGLSAIYQNADRVLLAWLSSDAIAGEYSLVYDISSRGLLLPVTALSGAASARILRLFNDGEARMAVAANRKLLRTQCLLICGVAVLVLAGSLIAICVVPWFGLEHAATAVITFLAAGIWALGDTLQRERLGSGKTGALVRWIAICAFGGVLANLIAIPLFGVVGAAVVTLTSSGVYVIFVANDVGITPDWFVFRRRRPTVVP